MAGSHRGRTLVRCREARWAPINVRYGPRRPGDPAVLVAARAKAERQLQWVPQYSEISQIVETAFAWYRRQTAQNGALRRKSDNKVRQVGTAAMNLMSLIKRDDNMEIALRES